MSRNSNFDIVNKEIYLEYVDDDTQLRKIFDDIEDVSAYFVDKMYQYEKNRNFYKGEQYTPYEKEVARSQYREPVVMNEIQVKVEHLMGSQVQTRLDSKCVAREVGDEFTAQILSNILKWAEQINTIEQIETSVFFDALIDGIGASIVRWKFEDVDYGYPSVEIINPEEIVFDLNAKYNDLRDARWIARLPLVTLADLSEIFPDKIDVLKKYSTSALFASKYKIPTYLSKRLNAFRNDDRRYVPFVEYFEYVKIYKYIVYDKIQDKKFIFDKQKDANDFYDGLVEEYTETGNRSILAPDGSSMIEKRKIIETAVEQTIVVGDEIIRREIIAVPKIPIQVCFAYWKSGDFWSYVEPMIPIQKIINNMMSTYDHILGSSAKNPTLVTIPFLDKNVGFEQVRRELSKPRAVIPVNNPNAITTLSDPPVNPQLFNFVGYLSNWLNEKAGGKNFLGYQENAAESGRAVLARAEQGGLIRLGMFDRLKSWRREVSYMLVWFIKYFMKTEQIIRVIGEDNMPVYIQLDNEILDSIRELKYDIIIDETYRSETMKERYFQQIKELAAVAPYPPEIIIPLLVKYSNLPKTTQDELLGMLNVYQTYKQQEQQQQHELKLQQQAEDSARRRMLREAILRQEEMDKATETLQKKTKEIKAKLSEAEELQQKLEETQGQNTAIPATEGVNTREEMSGIMGKIMQSKLM